MGFDDLDVRMRVYESAHDLRVLPETFLVARLDGRGFARLARDVRPFAVPFDPEFRDMMIATAEHLTDCGFRVVYAHTQSDEITLSLHQDESSYGHKLRKLDSALAGEASAKFSVLLGYPASFDCRICQLPNLGLVLDYLRWRFDDAQRSALAAHCYWTLRRLGHTKRDASRKLERLSMQEKVELLQSKGGVPFGDLPSWQKRGVGLAWQVAPGGASAEPSRRRIVPDFELPSGPQYTEYARKILESEHAGTQSQPGTRRPMSSGGRTS